MVELDDDCQENNLHRLGENRSALGHRIYFRAVDYRRIAAGSSAYIVGLRDKRSLLCQRLCLDRLIHTQRSEYSFLTIHTANMIIGESVHHT